MFAFITAAVPACVICADTRNDGPKTIAGLETVSRVIGVVYNNSYSKIDRMSVLMSFTVSSW